jgi:hypothetical protein
MCTNCTVGAQGLRNAPPICFIGDLSDVAEGLQSTGLHGRELIVAVMMN